MVLRCALVLMWMRPGVTTERLLTADTHVGLLLLYLCSFERPRQSYWSGMKAAAQVPNWMLASLAVRSRYS